MTTLAIEIGAHSWAQALPLRDRVLVCIMCRQRTPMGRITARDCAEVIAERTGAQARDGFVLTPL